MVMSSEGFLPVSVCNENYRPVLSSEKAHYMRKYVTVRKNKILNLVMGPERGARHQDELADWPSIAKSINHLTN
jgi:hypothetical protein